MRVEGRLKYNYAIIVNEDFIKDIDDLLKEYFEKPLYAAILLNGDRVLFDSALELVEYDNYSYRKIKTMSISFGRGNSMYIEPTTSFVNAYGATIVMDYTVDNNDICDEIKRKTLFIIDKHKQSKLYSLASKLSIMHLSILMMIICCGMSIHILIKPREEIVELPNSISFALVFLGMFCGVISAVLLRILVKKIFPPILVYLGENIRIIERTSKLKSNIFWCVFVTGIVSIIISRFSDIILFVKRIILGIN